MRSVYNNPKGAIINMLNNLTEHMNIKRGKGNVELLEAGSWKRLNLLSEIKISWGVAGGKKKKNTQLDDRWTLAKLNHRGKKIICTNHPWSHGSSQLT